MVASWAEDDGLPRNVREPMTVNIAVSCGMIAQNDTPFG